MSEAENPKETAGDDHRPSERNYRPPSQQEWAARRLCDDDSCIGVIGPDGCCKECGRPAESGPDPASAGPDDTPEAGDAEAVNGFGPHGGPGTESDAESDAADGPAPWEQGDDEWERRTLCRDESCIGVIGTDGRCKECGLPYKP